MLVKCLICGESFGQITEKHLKIHHMTFSSYKRKFPNSTTITEETKSKISVALRDNKERAVKISNTLKGREITWGSRISEVKKEQAKDPINKSKLLASLGNNPIHYRRPNIPESKLINILSKHFLNQYKYVGNGEVWIGNKNPDFINVDGKKQVIEVFGLYWHKDTNIQEIINHYAKYGFSTLIFWENELQKEMDVVYKIKNFPSVETLHELSSNG